MARIEVRAYPTVANSSRPASISRSRRSAWRSAGVMPRYRRAGSTRDSNDHVARPARPREKWSGGATVPERGDAVLHFCPPSVRDPQQGSAFGGVLRVSCTPAITARAALVDPADPSWLTEARSHVPHDQHLPADRSREPPGLSRDPPLDSLQ